MKNLETTCDCCANKWQRCDANKSDNDPVHVFYMLMLARIRAFPLDVVSCILILKRAIDGDYDPAFYHHHECLFICYLELAACFSPPSPFPMVCESFQLLVKGLFRTRYLCPKFRIMFCSRVKEKSQVYGNDNAIRFLCRALFELDEYPPLREHCTHRTHFLNLDAEEIEIEQNTVRAKNTIRGMLADLDISQERVDNMLEEAKSGMDEE